MFFEYRPFILDCWMTVLCSYSYPLIEASLHFPSLLLENSALALALVPIPLPTAFIKIDPPPQKAHPILRRQGIFNNSGSC